MKALITQRAREDRVPTLVVERDYILAHIIGGLAALEDSHNLIFKGGTALRLCHLEGHRYSADLDFSMVRGTRADGLDTIEMALEKAREVIDSLYLNTDAHARIVYVGPLGRERYLKIDISEDELVLEFQKQPLLRLWDDLPEDGLVPVYTLDQIAAEKLLCVMQRFQRRDFFDLFRLYGDELIDDVMATHIFRRKADYRDISVQGFADQYRNRVEHYRKNWKQELDRYVPGDVPHFKEVERIVTRKLRAANLL